MLPWNRSSPLRTTQLSDQILHREDQAVEPLLSTLMPCAMNLNLVFSKIDTAYVTAHAAARGLVRDHTPHPPAATNRGQ